VRVYATGDVWVKVGQALRQSGVRVLTDHLGDPDPSRGLDQPRFQSVSRFDRKTDAVVKLSALYRPSLRPFPHEDVTQFVGAVVDTFGLGRCVWGSDWPLINTAQQVES
jgi:predicted TIM-barrel fold metal-dependent hydrolase